MRNLGHRFPAGGVWHQQAVGHHQHLHEVAQRGRAVDGLGQARCRPQVFDRAIHEADAGRALFAWVRPLTDEYIADIVDRLSEEDRKAAMKEIRESEWFGLAQESGLNPTIKISPHSTFGRGQ